jgi:hypothetical protein
MLGQRRTWCAWGVVGVVAASVTSGCGDDFESCRESRTCAAAEGGEGGEAGEATESGTAGVLESNAGGGGGIAGSDGSSEGGTAVGGVGGVGGIGGVGGVGEEPRACADEYIDWFKSSFSFPSGDVIGTADFPSSPWVKTGSLKIDAGRLTGAGIAVASQGVVIPSANARVRFRARFTDSDQKVMTAFDAVDNGSGGVRVTLDAAGHLSVAEGKKLVGSADFPPVETGTDWFVEAVFSGARGEVSLARANYGTEKGAKVEVTLSTASLEAATTGKTSSVELVSASGVVPSIDEIAVATCGMPAPGYQPKLIDSFERADSGSLGNAEFPAGLAWSSSSTTIRIVNGALQTAGELAVATIPLQVPLTGLRIRTTLKVVMVETGPSSLWANVNVNVTQTSNGLPAQGFWVWGENSAFYTGIFTGGGEVKHQVALSSAKKYYAQMDRDGDVAVVTVSEQSFDGPILGAQFAGALLPNAEPGGFFSLGDEGGAGVRFEDVRVDTFSSE